MTKTQDQSTLLSAADLAEMLSVPLGTIYGWRYKSAGPRAIKVGRHLRYRLSEVERWLDEQSGVHSLQVGDRP